jgi:hypothetical protein
VERGDRAGTIRRLGIGRKVSELISRSHNARARFNAYDTFIRLIESNREDFSAVWKYRMGVPKKKREGEEFLDSLRSQSRAPKGREALALRLLWLLEREG